MLGLRMVGDAMRTFQSSESWQVKSRGWIVYNVPCPVTCQRDDLSDVIGKRAIIDGVEHEILGIDSWAISTIREGVTIGLAVKA